MYDYLIVGSGFFGAVCAYQLRKAGKSVLVLDKRNHIGGNCYTSNRDGIEIHNYGPHIFHTKDKEVWDWINQFTKFNDFTLRPVAVYKNKSYSLPFNMWTFSQMWDNIVLPEQAQRIIKEQSQHIGTPTNLEEAAIKAVGTDVYEKLIKGYTEKQWMKPCTELPASIIKRLPVRYSYDNNYFSDPYQGIPIDGYTNIFKKLLKNIPVKFNVNYLEDRSKWNSMAEKVIYTGPIDRYFNFCYGDLEYKSTRFEHRHLDCNDFQGTVMMNYTEKNIPFTRIVEHKHFIGQSTDSTWITYEYPQQYTRHTDAMYPVNDSENNQKYESYKKLSESQDKVLFGGRLAEYKYYNMDQVIKSALTKVEKWMNHAS